MKTGGREGAEHVCSAAPRSNNASAKLTSYNLWMKAELICAKRAPITSRRLARQFPQFTFSDVLYHFTPRFSAPLVVLSFRANQTVITKAMTVSDCSTVDETVRRLEAWALEYEDDD